MTIRTSRSRCSTAPARCNFSPDTIGRPAVLPASPSRPPGRTSRPEFKATEAGGSTIGTRCAGGFLAQIEQASANHGVQRTDGGRCGMQTSTQPINIIDNQNSSGGLYGIYAQDEWRLAPKLTLNYGARFDMVEQFTHESQISPRITWSGSHCRITTLHIGYARYFVPPPYEALTSASIAKFAGTDSSPRRDPGRHRARRTLQLFRCRDQPGSSCRALTPRRRRLLQAVEEPDRRGPVRRPDHSDRIQLRRGQADRGRTTASYDHGPLSLYANLAWSRAMGKDINSAQFNFAPD